MNFQKKKEMGVLKEDSLDSLEAAERAYYVAAIEQQHSDMSKTLGPILHTLISPTKVLCSLVFIIDNFSHNFQKKTTD